MTPADIQRRDSLIAEAWQRGETGTSIAERFGISKVRVTKIIQRMGLPARPVGGLRGNMPQSTNITPMGWPAWCAQCERRVHPREASACTSEWCKAPELAA